MISGIPTASSKLSSIHVSSEIRANNINYMKENKQNYDRIQSYEGGKYDSDQYQYHLHYEPEPLRFIDIMIFIHWSSSWIKTSEQ